MDHLKLVALMVVPFLLVPGMAEQRELPRHVLVEVVAFAGLALALARTRPLPVPAVMRAFSIVTASLLLSTVAGESPGRSFFGPYEGHTGALAWLACLTLAATAPRREALIRLSLGASAAGAVQVLVAVRQIAGGDPPTGTLGHVMFVAGFMLVTSLVTLGLALGAAGWKQLVLAGAFVLQAGVLIFAARRGPLVGFALALSVITLLLHRRRVMSPVFAAVGMLVVLVVVAPSGANQERLTDRVAHTLSPAAVEAGHDTASQRLDFYRVAFAAALDRPVLGYGLVPVWAAAADGLMGHGSELESSSHRDDGIRAYQQAIAMMPPECLYALKLASALRASGPATAAERQSLLEDCARREPRNAFVHHHLGLAYRDDAREPIVQRSRAISSLARA